MMRSIVTLLFASLCSLSGKPDNAAKSGLAALLSKAQYEHFFPHHHPIYSYEALIKAADAFPAFVTEGSASVRRRELAAFLGEIAHETTNGGDGAAGGPYVWGLFYTEELNCQGGRCPQYNAANGGPYQPVPGKDYFGRGPIQLSYAYNYGQAGSDLHLPLLEHPELVSHDGTVAFETALWFWMRSDPHEPSCHAVMTGKWQPTAADTELGRRPGFGMTINIINGNVECRAQSAAARRDREDRIGHYRYFATLLGTTVEKDCDCAGMKPYGN